MQTPMYMWIDFPKSPTVDPPGRWSPQLCRFKGIGYTQPTAGDGQEPLTQNWTVLLTQNTDRDR